MAMAINMYCNRKQKYMSTMHTYGIDAGSLQLKACSAVSAIIDERLCFYDYLAHTDRSTLLAIQIILWRARNGCRSFILNF